MRLKTGDTVKVVTGSRKDKGTVAEIIKVIPHKNQVLVEGVNLKKKHLKPSQINPDGGIIEKEMPVDVSNVMAYDKKTKSVSRLGIEIKDGKKVRIFKKTGKEY
ncbi:MAG: 50S ribosomal protein L24 [Erysipelothrix sp.]|nr:50S ribosomal protein L24 [Erysipelothrix sp.]